MQLLVHRFGLGPNLFRDFFPLRCGGDVAIEKHFSLFVVHRYYLRGISLSTSLARISTKLLSIYFAALCRQTGRG